MGLGTACGLSRYDQWDAVRVNFSTWILGEQFPQVLEAKIVAKANNQQSWRRKSPEPTKITRKFSTWVVAGCAGSFMIIYTYIYIYIIWNWPVLHMLCVVASFPTDRRKVVRGDQSVWRLWKQNWCLQNSILHRLVELLNCNAKSPGP